MPPAFPDSIPRQEDRGSVCLFSTLWKSLWEITVYVTTDKIMNAWDQIKRRLGETISPDAYRNWVLRTSLRSADGDSIVITTPDEATRWFMESEYADSVQGAIRDLNLPYRNISYEIGEAAEMQPRPEPSADARPCFPGRRARSTSNSTSITS